MLGKYVEHANAIAQIKKDVEAVKSASQASIDPAVLQQIQNVGEKLQALDKAAPLLDQLSSQLVNTQGIGKVIEWMNQIGPFLQQLQQRVDALEKATNIDVPSVDELLKTAEAAAPQASMQEEVQL